MDDLMNDSPIVDKTTNDAPIERGVVVEELPVEVVEPAPAPVDTTVDTPTEPSFRAVELGL